MKVKENQVIVESMLNWTTSINSPEYHVNFTWTAPGQKHPFDRDELIQICYEPGYRYLFAEGYLKCDDKEFLDAMGLLDEDEKPVLLDVNEQLMKRMSTVMPMQEFKETLAKMTQSQIQGLVDYIIDNPSELKIEKAELLSKMTGKNILKTIEFAKED